MCHRCDNFPNCMIRPSIGRQNDERAPAAGGEAVGAQLARGRTRALTPGPPPSSHRPEEPGTRRSRSPPAAARAPRISAALRPGSSGGLTELLRTPRRRWAPAARRTSPSRRRAAPLPSCAPHVRRPPAAPRPTPPARAARAPPRQLRGLARLLTAACAPAGLTACAPSSRAPASPPRARSRSSCTTATTTSTSPPPPVSPPLPAGAPQVGVLARRAA